MRPASILFLLLCGCSGLVPGTALLLGAADPLAADPGDITVTLDLPPGLGVLPGSVQLALSAEREGFGDVGGVWVLEETRDPLERRVFSIPEAVQADIRSVQATARAWENADPEATRGSLSVSLMGCRAVPAARLVNARVSVFIRLTPDGPERPLFRDAPISSVLSNEDLAALPDCP